MAKRIALPDKRVAIYDGQYNAQNWFIVHYANGVQYGRFSEAEINAGFHGFQIMQHVEEEG